MTTQQFLNLYAAAEAEGALNYGQFTERMRKAGGYSTPAVAYQAYKRFGKRIAELAKLAGKDFTLPELEGRPQTGTIALTWDDLSGSHGKLLASMAKKAGERQRKAKGAAAK
jgi:hypothetical protein